MTVHPAVGRTQVRTDSMDPIRTRTLATTLGIALPEGPLPPFFHRVHFWEAEPAEALGRDGNPRVGGFIPDLGLPRRMWAGGRLRFPAPLLAGQPATCESTILSVAHKTGRSGALAFVTLRHRVHQAGQDRVIEEQDLVYREEAHPDAAPPAARPAPPDGEPEPVSFGSTLLFRYSALTFNGHRIHYDADYARQVEGYAAPVVHGPLLAQLLMLKAARIGSLAGFSFRGARALTLGESAVLCRDGTALWVRNGTRDLVMEAQAEWA